MSLKRFLIITFGSIILLTLLAIGFYAYEWILKNEINREIDNILPKGEYLNDAEVLSQIKPNETITNFPDLHPKLIQKIYNNPEGFKYKYSLSSGRGVYYVRRTPNGSLHQMHIWAKSVLTKNGIYWVSDVDSLIAALNRAYPLLSKELKMSIPDGKQRDYESLDLAIKEAESITLGNTHCKLTNRDCSDSFGIPIEVGDYRFIFDGECGFCKEISMHQSFYQIKANTLRWSTVCIGIIIFLFMIILFQEVLDNKKNKSLNTRSSYAIKSRNYDNTDKHKDISSSQYCPHCGKVIEDCSKYCKYCGKSLL